MSKFYLLDSFAPLSRDVGAGMLPPFSRATGGVLNADALIARMERQRPARADTVNEWAKPAAGRPYEWHLEYRLALDVAWQREVQALIAMRRSDDPRAARAAAAARRGTEEVVRRIESRRAATRAERALKALAAEWRGCGGPDRRA